MPMAASREQVEAEFARYADLFRAAGEGIDPERPLDAVEASELLGYATDPPQTVQKLCREGKLKHWRAGKEIRTLRRWVLEYRDSVAVGGAP